MADEKIIDPRYIEELRKYSASGRKDNDDAMAQVMAGQAVFHPDSPFVSIEARSHVNTKLEIPRDPDIFKPTKSMLDILSECIGSDLNKRLTEFGETNGFPVVFVFHQTLKNENGVSKSMCDIKMYKRSEMREAADFARRNGGELGIFNSEIKYIDELNPQPVLDGPLPKFCKAHHCTERGPKCDKCAYTAFSGSQRRWLEA